MKTLLVAINASFSHTCLAVRSLYNFLVNNFDISGGEESPWLQSPRCAAVFSANPSSGPQTPARNARFCVDFAEFTINQPVGEILRGIALYEPDIVLFSTYIWNAEITAKIIPDVKKILPEAIVGAGGPEFGFAPEIYFKKLPALDFICFGEGERVLKNVVETLESFFEKKILNENIQENLCMILKNVPGLYLPGEHGAVFTGEQPLICDLAELPFPYPELEAMNSGTLPEKEQTYLFNKIYYYESSRGCPYSCSYCMSSLDKRVRFMPLDRVFKDLQTFLDAKVPLVKFVDRTYNLQPDRYIGIWRYIVEHHNGITMFHFEIEAEYLSEEALEFLQNVPAGVMQFEIGVQSANKKTLMAVNRSPNVEKLAENVKKVPRTIHQHLDLIAGLPYEDMESFGKSFDFVMTLQPDALQLGFLKVLHGTQMEAYALANGWKWMENPVYETFSTPYMSYTDMLFLKDLEVVLDAYWNSGKFPHLMAYIGRNMSWWQFFFNFTKWAQEKEVFSVARRETYWYELFAVFIKEIVDTDGIKLDGKLLYDLLRYDFVLRGKQGGFPKWYEHRYDKERHRTMLENNGGITNARLDFAHSEYEVFDYNVDSKEPENAAERYEKLLRY